MHDCEGHNFRWRLSLAAARGYHRITGYNRKCVADPVHPVKGKINLENVCVDSAESFDCYLQWEYSDGHWFNRDTAASFRSTTC